MTPISKHTKLGKKKKKKKKSGFVSQDLNTGHRARFLWVPTN